MKTLEEIRFCKLCWLIWEGEDNEFMAGEIAPAGIIPGLNRRDTNSPAYKPRIDETNSDIHLVVRETGSSESR